MSERSAFLRSIEESPADDTARLAYADWLDENTASDADRATSEFIRTSCDMRTAKDRQGVNEGRWLEANWRRLVPRFACRVGRRGRRNGRWVHAVASVPVGMGDRVVDWTTYVALEFWRGFVRNVRLDAPIDVDVVLPELCPNQPFVCPDVIYDIELSADPSGPTRLTPGDLGSAWQFVRGRVETRGTELAVLYDNDPFGLKARRARLKAFRAFARHLSKQAGVL